MNQVICNMCGVMKTMNEECPTCKSYFQAETNPNATVTIPSVEPTQIQSAYTKPLNTYTTKLANGSSIEVYMYSATRIVAFLKDTNGVAVSSEEFKDIKTFQKTVETLKDTIANELKQLEECRKLMEELGFAELADDESK